MRLPVPLGDRKGPPLQEVSKDLSYRVLTSVLLTVNASKMNAQEADETDLVHSVYLPVVLNSTDSAIDEISGIELHDEEIFNSETLFDITPAFTAGATSFLKVQGQQIVDGTGRSVK